MLTLKGASLSANVQVRVSGSELSFDLADLMLQYCDAQTLLSSHTRHRDKDAEFVTLCKSLHVTDSVCDHAWKLWNNVQDSIDNVTVCLYTTIKSIIVFSLFNIWADCLGYNPNQLITTFLSVCCSSQRPPHSCLHIWQ